MKIRKATEADMPEILDLIRELAAFEKQPQAVEISVADLIKDGFGPQALFHVIVAEVDQQIVGMALYYFRYSTWKGKTLHLEDLIVREKVRGTGVGQALYSQIILLAQEAGVKRAEWVVLNWNSPAIAFYEKSGAEVLSDWQLVQMDQKGIDQFIARL